MSNTANSTLVPVLCIWMRLIDNTLTSFQLASWSIHVAPKLRATYVWPTGPSSHHAGHAWHGWHAWHTHPHVVIPVSAITYTNTHCQAGDTCTDSLTDIVTLTRWFGDTDIVTWWQWQWLGDTDIVIWWQWVDECERMRLTDWLNGNMRVRTTGSVWLTESMRVISTESMQVIDWMHKWEGEQMSSKWVYEWEGVWMTE